MNIRLISPIPFDATRLHPRGPELEWPECPILGLAVTELDDDSLIADDDRPSAPAPRAPGPGRSAG